MRCAELRKGIEVRIDGSKAVIESIGPNSIRVRLQDGRRLRDVFPGLALLIGPAVGIAKSRLALCGRARKSVQVEAASRRFRDLGSRRKEVLQ